MMTIKTPFNFTTPDQVKIYCYKWEKTRTTNKRVKGLIQIAHAMAEHIRRYDSFSQHLTDHGFIVFGTDHRGHGQTASNKNDQGVFTRKDGFEKVVDDMKQLTAIMKEEYPHTPVFLLGHSMRSFLTRRYIQKSGESLQGVVLSGTGSDKGIISKIGILLAKLEVKRIGAQTPSPFLDKLTFGQYNKKYQVQRTKFDFLSRDERLVDEYITDDHCGF